MFRVAKNKKHRRREASDDCNTIYWASQRGDVVIACFCDFQKLTSTRQTDSIFSYIFILLPPTFCPSSSDLIIIYLFDSTNFALTSMSLILFPPISIETSWNTALKHSFKDSSRKLRSIGKCSRSALHNQTQHQQELVLRAEKLCVFFYICFF